jgi:FtsP/CotA-like multicopper oxidase with cupredoxin domain
VHSPMSRRSMLLSGTAALACQGFRSLAQGSGASKFSTEKPDHTLRIEPCSVEIAKGVVIRTFAYNGQVPGPLLRLKEGVPVTIDVTNATEKEDIVHWHGLATDSLNDGAMEEGSPMIAPGSTLRYRLVPRPSGTRWYHTHASAKDGATEDLTRGTYSGQFGFLLVEGSNEPAAYDQEVNLAIHHWEPQFVPMVETMRSVSANKPQTSGSDVGYKYATINMHTLGEGEPIRVRQGQRILLRLLNASATENVVLALPGHSFKILAMDGNPVPISRSVEALSLAVAERVDAIVEMNHPGVWVLGSTLQESRQMGLGIVVEYEGRSGPPMWMDPAPVQWDYTQFAGKVPVQEPEKTYTMTFRDAGALNGSQFDTWTINDDAWPDIKPLEVQKGKRYRLLFRNASGDQHPMHLHRHTFELTSVGGISTSGLRKDVVNVMPLDTVAVDFVADNPGDTLVHCHQQLHMDYGFMQLIKYVG